MKAKERTRQEIATKAYEEGRLDQSTFGQLACNNFSDEIVERAVCRNWITSELANEILGLVVIPKITARRTWSRYSVINACIRNDLYTLGENEEYERMLNMVDEMYPDINAIYMVAKDICKHSECQTIANVMYILENDVVTTTFEIDSDDNC